jgi:hypothetical protein
VWDLAARTRHQCHSLVERFTQYPPSAKPLKHKESQAHFPKWGNFYNSLIYKGYLQKCIDDHLK